MSEEQWLRSFDVLRLRRSIGKKERKEKKKATQTKD